MGWINTKTGRCNHTKQQRKVWITEAVRSTSHARVYALCLNVDVDECRKRVAERENHPTLNAEEEQKFNVVEKFLSEADEVRNKEGFLKIYRTGGKEYKGDEDEIIQRILRETSFFSSSPGGKLRVGAQPFSPSQAKQGAAATSEIEGLVPKGSQLDSSKHVILLFDLNGTLINKTDKRKKNKGIKVRPGVNALIQLHRRGFVLGVYSSSTLKTCVKAINRLMEELGWEDSDPEEENEKKEEKVLFQHVLHREFCQLMPNIAGSAWDTVKPLGQYLSDINKCILFDDDEYKVLEKEKHHHVLVPAWAGNEDDDIITQLVDSTLKHISTSEDEDVRLAAAKISLDLLEHEEMKKGSQQQAIAGGGGTDSPDATGLANLSLQTT